MAEPGLPQHRLGFLDRLSQDDPEGCPHRPRPRPRALVHGAGHVSLSHTARQRGIKQHTPECGDLRWPRYSEAGYRVTWHPRWPSHLRLEGRSTRRTAIPGGQGLRGGRAQRHGCDPAARAFCQGGPSQEGGGLKTMAVAQEGLPRS